MSLGFADVTGGVPRQADVGGVLGRRMRVGYACSEFGVRHSIMLLLRGLFEAHRRRSRVASLCIDTRRPPAVVGPAGPAAAADSGGLEPACGEWVAVGGLGDAEAAAAVNAASLHILVDLVRWLE